MEKFNKEIKLMTIEEELAKNPNLKEKDLIQFKEWAIATHPLFSKFTVKYSFVGPTVNYILSQYFVDMHLAIVLNSCDFDLELAKKTVTSLLNAYVNLPEFFGDLNVEEERLAKTIDTQLVYPICQLPSGNLIIMNRTMDKNPENYHFEEVAKLFYAVNFLHCKEYGLIPGMEVILDPSSASLSHFARISIFSLRKAIAFSQDSAPVRIKKIHFVNVQPWMERFLNLVKLFIRKEYSEMLQLHTSFETLHKFVPEQYLPKDYGGAQPPLNELHQKMKQHLLANRELLLEEGKIIQDYREAKLQERARKSLLTRWTTWT